MRPSGVELDPRMQTSLDGAGGRMGPSHKNRKKSKRNIKHLIAQSTQEASLPEKMVTAYDLPLQFCHQKHYHRLFVLAANNFQGYYDTKSPLQNQL